MAGMLTALIYHFVSGQIWFKSAFLGLNVLKEKMITLNTKPVIVYTNVSSMIDRDHNVRILCSLCSHNTAYTILQMSAIIMDLASISTSLS